MRMSLAKMKPSSGKSTINVAVLTLLSRGTGLLRVSVTAAVLGPTFLGNTFQSANLLPNMIYELLAGALFSSLLVPVLVKILDDGDGQKLARVSGSLLGLVVVVFSILALALALLGSLVVGLLGVAVSDAEVRAAQIDVGSMLVVLVAPQLVLYGVIGCAQAAQIAAGRFALTMGLPALENVTITGALLLYGFVVAGGDDVTSVTTTQVLWLGGTSTLAVAIHAGAQWLGAARAGIKLVPRFHWRDPEVIGVVRLAVPSLGYTAFQTARLFATLIGAGAIAGGVLAFQLALNFYSLPEALIGRPIGQVMLPRLSRAFDSGARVEFSRILMSGMRVCVFVGVPAAVALGVLAPEVARLVAAGEMASNEGRSLISDSLAGIALGALLQGLVYLGSNAYYARRNTFTPFLLVAARSVLAVVAMVVYFRSAAPGISLLTLGLIVSFSDLVAVFIMMAAGLRSRSERDVLRDSLHSVLSALSGGMTMLFVMVSLKPSLAAMTGNPLATLFITASVGAVVYVIWQLATRSPDPRLILNSVRRS